MTSRHRATCRRDYILIVSFSPLLKRIHLCRKHAMGLAHFCPVSSLRKRRISLKKEEDIKQQDKSSCDISSAWRTKKLLYQKVIHKKLSCKKKTKENRAKVETVESRHTRFSHKPESVTKGCYASWTRIRNLVYVNSSHFSVSMFQQIM